MVRCFKKYKYHQKYKCAKKCQFLERRGMVDGEAWKNYSHKYILQRKSCDCNFQKCEKTCFKSPAQMAFLTFIGEVWKSIKKYKKYKCIFHFYYFWLDSLEHSFSSREKWSANELNEWLRPIWTRRFWTEYFWWM